MNKIIVLNQKSYMEYNEVLNFINEIKDNIRRDLDVIICPSSIYLPYYKGKYDFKLGSQNVYIKNITGEYTSKSLKSMGVNYVIIGHFERKYYLNEDFENLPSSIQRELQIMCVLYTEDIGGILTLEFDSKGNLNFITAANEGDLLYDEIGSALMIKKMREERKELLEALEMYYKVFFLGQAMEEE